MRKQIIKVIKILQREQCAYDIAGVVPNGIDVKPPSKCDCKFGYKGKVQNNPISECTGCPELRVVAGLLRKMTDKEFSAILEREKPKPIKMTNSCVANAKEKMRATVCK